MLTLRLPKELELRLENLAEFTGRTKTYYAKKALEKYLEDQEDYLIAIARLEKNNPKISLDEVEKRVRKLGNKI
ncbi:MAG: TraY domain-containing protein [Gammaproteobacteria bacterium]|nr:TraY domain-containing protein [Gammaproteobacteria bacterium]